MAPSFVSGFWVGPTLPPLAELCIRSFLDHGIGFRLFTYEKYPNIPEGTTVCDAAKILKPTDASPHAGGSLSPSGDLFRYELLWREGGIWTDMDMVCLRPTLPTGDVWFAFEAENKPALGIVAFPPRHPLMKAMRDLAYDPCSPMPWDPPEEIRKKAMHGKLHPDVMSRRTNAPWGIAGPEAFARGVRHFDLGRYGEAPTTIYPVPWTVWRNAYNGQARLTGAPFRGAWAVHLWGEMLRREPDAFKNRTPDSVVAELLERHSATKPERTAPHGKKKVSIVVGICSSKVHPLRRQAVRETWMRNVPPGIECLFFTGNTGESDTGETDTVRLDAPDDYAHLPKKVGKFFEYAVANYDFDWLFKCDDDTYVALDRLASLTGPDHDLIGDPSLGIRGAPSGGAGYMLSRKYVEDIVRTPNVPATGFEDIIFGHLALKAGARPLSTEKLCYCTARYPRKTNGIVSAHWCSPELMRMLDTIYRMSPDSAFLAKHPAWTDTVLFYKSGIFARKSTGCCGTWEEKDSRMHLRWMQWPEEVLDKKDTGYAAEDFTLTPLSAPARTGSMATVERPVPFVIFSTPRSRSTLLVRILDTSPGIRCNGECNGFLGRMKKFHDERADMLRRLPDAFASLESHLEEGRFPCNLNHSEAARWDAVFPEIFKAWTNPSDEAVAWGMKDVHVAKDGVQAGFELWSWLQNTIPGMKLIFLTRNRDEVIKSMRKNSDWWTASYGSGPSEWMAKLEAQQHAFREYHALNPSTTAQLDAEEFFDFHTVAEKLGKLGISVDAAAHAAQMAINV